MDYWWIYLSLVPLLALCFSNRDNTWAPFQSQQVKEICAHMTPGEKRAATARGAMFGVVVGLGFGSLPLGYVLFVDWDKPPFSAMSNLIFVLLSILFLALIGCAFLLWLRYYHGQLKKFLATTEWSKQQGLGPEDIVLRDF